MKNEKPLCKKPLDMQLDSAYNYYITRILSFGSDEIWRKYGWRNMAQNMDTPAGNCKRCLEIPTWKS